MQQKHEQLQAQEKQLESDLTLFDLKYTKSMEFDIEEVRNILVFDSIVK